MTRYQIDPETASVTVSGSSTLHPIVAVAPATGWFEAELIEGRFVEGSVLTGRLEIALADLKSGNPLIDRETRRRLKAEEYPLIVAEITETRRVQGQTAVIAGNVSFLGETIGVAGKLALSMGPTLVGEGTFDIRSWGVEPPRLLAVRVHPDISVRVDLPLV
jgi:hypothetical protein